MVGGGNSLYRNFSCINFSQAIYKNKYLFALSQNDERQSVEVFRINDTPKWISSFLLSSNVTNFNTWFLTICVVGDLLVARSSTRFNVYKISLPDCSFSYMHPIHCPYMPRTSENAPRVRVSSRSMVIVSHFLFYRREMWPLVQVWDLQSGKELDSIYPKIDGENFDVFCFSLNEKYMLLSVGLNSNSERNPYLFVYSIESLQYMKFCVVLEPYLSRTVCSGLIDDNYVVLISIPEQLSNRCSNHSADIYVYDLHTSELQAQKLGVEHYQGYSLLINRSLVFPAFQTVKVMSLLNLDTIWEIRINDLKWIKSIALPNSLFHMMVVAKSDELMEFWDFENRKKCFELHCANNFAVNDTFSKITVVEIKKRGERTLNVLNFW